MNQLDLTDIGRTLHPKTVNACSQVHMEINETKSCFFEKINKYDKLLPKLTKEKKALKLLEPEMKQGTLLTTLQK